MAIDPTANPPIEQPAPSAAPPTAASSPSDAPPTLSSPHATPPIASTPTAMSPIAMIPLAIRGCIVAGSIPPQTCTSGHEPIAHDDLYSYAIRGPQPYQRRVFTGTSGLPAIRDAAIRLRRVRSAARNNASL